jgi:hypothetical protein
MAFVAVFKQLKSSTSAARLTCKDFIVPAGPPSSCC